MSRNVLVVEDDRDLAGLVALHLRDIGCAVEIAYDGLNGLESARSGKHDLAVLDRMLPRLSGLAICREIRASEHYIPILMLTAKATELDRVTGLDAGADDYLTKPFSILELTARVKALFRRMEAFESGPPEGNASLTIGELHLDPARRSAERRGQSLALTAREFDLLLHFARHPGRVFSRSALLDSVWGYGHDGYEHTVNSHINRLRAKLERNPRQPDYILTVWGVGYKFAETLPLESGSPA